MPSQLGDYTIHRYGQEQEPIVIIDGFSGHVAELLEHAATAQFTPAGVGYPGLRALADGNYILARGKLLADIFYDVFGFETGGRTESCTYSIVTTPPHALTPAQRIPHYDGTSANLLAMLHYLKGPETGGTSFYRHRRTGFETITPARIAAYKSSLAEDVEAHGPPAPKYFYGDDERYEMIADIQARPDRLILYRGRTLHSGSIPSNLKLTSDPRTARLTVNTFLLAL